MKLLKFLSCAAAFAAFLASGSVNALVIGAPGDANDGNCFPFGCAGWGSEYQQVYAAANFSGPMSITNLRFYNTQFDIGGVLNSGLFTISLSTTSAAVNALSTTFSLNLGANNAIVFSGSIPASVTFGGFFDIFVSPFAYNPGAGNLLLDVQSSDATGGSAYLDAHNNGTFGGLSSRLYNPASASEFWNGWGLVTGFNEALQTNVPEPASLLLFAAGLAVLGLGRRRRPV